MPGESRTPARPPVDAAEIAQRKQAVVERYGPWTSHNIHLGGGLYTRDDRQVKGSEIRARRLLQVVADVAGRPLDELRILDLGCNEGLFGIEMALHGARVVGIEGREPNVERARFAAEVLGLDNVEFVQDDVRNLSREKYGQFDVVLCLGLLYHLDANDVFPFAERLAEVTGRFAIVDTHVCLKPTETHEYKGRSYAGRPFVEHREGSDARQRAELQWASLDNPTSFWPTRPSLYNLLDHAGFSSVYECHNPAYPANPVDRVVLVALKGEPRSLAVSPMADAVPAAAWPEQPARRVSHGLRWYYKPVFLLSELARLLPAPVKRLGRKLLGKR